MDLRTHFAVVQRFKWLVAAGFALAVFLAVFSVARLDLKHGGLSYRSPELWMSQEVLLVTQSGFPIGQSVYNEVLPLRTGNGGVLGQSGGNYVPRYANDGRFAALAVLYARLANSDPVERLIFAHGPVKGGVSIAATGVSDAQAGPLPLIQVVGMGTSRSSSVAMAHTAQSDARSISGSKVTPSR